MKGKNKLNKPLDVHKSDVPVFDDVALGNPSEPLEQVPQMSRRTVVRHVSNVQLRAARSPRRFRFVVASAAPVVRRSVVITVRKQNICY